MNDKEKQLIRAYKSMGELVYEDLMKECYMNHPTHNVENVNETFVLGGKRAIGLYIKEQRDYDLSKETPKVKDSKQVVET